MERYNDWLSHHGILGQRWGKRNGPPYPLRKERMSNRERKLVLKGAREAAEENRKNNWGIQSPESNKKFINWIPQSARADSIRNELRDAYSKERKFASDNNFNDYFNSQHDMQSRTSFSEWLTKNGKDPNEVLDELTSYAQAENRLAKEYVDEVLGKYKNERIPWFINNIAGVGDAEVFVDRAVSDSESDAYTVKTDKYTTSTYDDNGAKEALSTLRWELMLAKQTIPSPGVTKTTNVDKAYRFLEKELGPHSKITDDELIDLVGMEAQEFYHLTDKEVDEIVKAYKKS